MSVRAMYVVATNRGTWGKGTVAVEALFNAMRQDSSATVINVICITEIPEEAELWTSVGMDAEGRVFYPKGSTVDQYSVKAPAWLGRKFADLYGELNIMLERTGDGTE